MTDFDYEQPEISEENEGDEDSEGASSAAAAAERMAAESEGSGTSDVKKPAHAHSAQDSASSSGGSLERAASTPTTASGSDSANDAGKRKPSEKEVLRELQNVAEGHKEKKSDVVQDLATGDTLIKDGKTQHLFMPNGDRLKVNPDGSFDLKTKEKVNVKTEKGVTTITYPNGESIELDQQGIRGIQRGNIGVGFARPGDMQNQKPKPDAGGENGPNVIRELKPIKPGHSSGSGDSTPNSLPNIIRERLNSIPESGSTPREARPAGSVNGSPAELSQEQLKKILRSQR